MDLILQREIWSGSCHLCGGEEPQRCHYAEEPSGVGGLADCDGH